MIPAACGGASTAQRGAGHPGGRADGGSDAKATLETSPPPSGLPPLAVMPPPGVVGSKKGKLRSDPALAACSGAFASRSKDPADLLRKIGESCSAASKMKPIGAVLRGQQGDRDVHQESKLHAEANHCYRLYVVSDDTTSDVVAVVRDGVGDIVAESPAPAVPARGAMCFVAADDITLLVSVGSGKGSWAAQVWGD